MYRYLQRRYSDIYFQTTIDTTISDVLKFFRSQHGLNVDHIDNFYLDMNAIIHNSAQEVFCYGNYATRIRKTKPSLSETYNSVTDNVDRLVKIVEPKELLYMAVDGVCPNPKQQNQRQRRYGSSVTPQTNTINPRLRPPRGESKSSGQDSLLPPTATSPYASLFNSSSISPSTPFMQELDRHIKKYLRKINVKTIYSSHEDQGEGEHKIMDYLRKNIDAVKTKTHGIYGLDADFFMLALATQCPNIFLVREDLADMSMHYVSIDLLRRSLIGDLSNDGHPDAKTIIDDFVLICIMVGNDFLRPIASFEDLPFVMDVVLDAYAKFSLPLTSDRRIISENVRKFFQNLLNSQQTILNRNVANSRKHIEPDPALVNATTAGIKDGIFTESINIEKWEKEYYHDRFGNDTIRDKICQSYYIGLDWICRYYFTGCPDWRWFYPYHYSPTLRDLSLYKYRPILFKGGKAVQPIVQLLAIMPPTASDMIPAKYRHLMLDENSPLAKYYPKTVKMDLKGCTAPWHGTLLLPFVNHREIEQAVKDVDDKMKKIDKIG